MTDQVLAQAQESASEFYRRIEREWEESQEDAVLSFNELAVLYDCLADGAFTDDYAALAKLDLEVSDAG